MVGRDTDDIRPLGVSEFEVGQRIAVVQAHGIVAVECTEEELELRGESSCIKTR